MALMLDARIPVGIAPAAPGQARALLLATDAGTALEIDAALHFAGCGCGCVAARSPVAITFDHIFLARMRGEIPFFRRMTVACRDADAEAVLREVVRNDPVMSTRFRLD